MKPLLRSKTDFGHECVNNEFKLKRSFKHLLKIITLTWIGWSNLSGLSVLAQERDFADLIDCDTPGGFSSRLGRNLARERGTIGSLFQWSGGTDESRTQRLASDEDLVTDRPDFTEASSVVGLGVLQIESGSTYAHDTDGTVRTQEHSYPEMLLRYGIFANWLEFRLATNFANNSVSSVRSAGAEDLYLGFKIGLTEQAGLRPEMSLIPQMTVPTSSSDLTSDELLAGLNWLYGWEINDIFSTTASTQFNKSHDEITSNTYTEWAQSWTIGYSLTDRLGGYTEYFGFYPSGADTARVQHYFDGGLTFGLSSNVQFDLRAGKGLNDAANDYFVGTGLSIRIP